MTTITFDTLKFVEKLEKAGVPREQAKAGRRPWPKFSIPVPRNS